jgi:hypothetical protein
MIALAYETQDVSDAVRDLTEPSKSLRRTVEREGEGRFKPYRYEKVKEEARIELRFNKGGRQSLVIRIYYHKNGKFHNEFQGVYLITEAPVKLYRGMLRLACSDELIRLLQEAYDEMLLEACGFVDHDELHTDTGGYDV